LTMTRYHYDSVTRKCEPFQFFGCSSNGNNFASKLLCEQFCVEKAIPKESDCNGLSPLVDPSNSVQQCDSSVSCPSGFVCNSQKRCCPTP
uniref:BPTI/Kunitz inhibitor domain-containing protein n=1 Tax=Anisakis simplex TaxID=6269 RepID=A0A0M3JM83_ANISI